MPRSERRSSRDSRREEASPYGSTGLSSRLDGMGVDDDSTREAAAPQGMAPVRIQYGKKGKVKDDDGELTRNKSMVTRGSKMLSFRKTASKPTLKAGGDDDDGGLVRSSSMFRTTSLMKSGALTGTTQPTNLKITLTRSLGNRIGLELNRRNRITGVDPNTPASKAGLLAFDLVLSVDGKTTDGELMSIIDPNATEFVFEIERPHKSQHKKIVMEENAAEMAVREAASAEPEKPKMPRQKTATTNALAAAGFALKRRSSEEKRSQK